MASHSPSAFADLREQVVHECAAMARYALASGMTVPPQLVATIEKIRATPPGEAVDMGAVARTHAQLAKLVAPATPRALLLLGDEDHATMSRVAWLGHVGIARRMMLVAAIAVLAFLAVNVSDLVVDPTKSLLEAQGWGAVVLEIWWVSAAAMGASFAMLMQVGDYIVKRTYDPKYEPIYWIKFLLGIIAGLILASLVPVSGTGPVAEFGKPTLALLGGFSAAAVYRILNRLVETVESFFRPNAKDEIAQRQREAQSRATEESSQTRVALAGQIVKLQQQVASGAASEDVSRSLQAIIESLVPGGDDTSAPEQPAGTIALPGIPVVAAPVQDTSAGDSTSPASEPSEATPTASTDETAPEAEPADATPAAAADASSDEPAATTTASEPAAG